MPLALLIAFIVVPIVELWIVFQVGDLVGLAPTLVLLVVMSVAGAWLVKREGKAAWQRFRAALGTKLPAVEVVDGALVLVGGTLLLTPGFLTDAVGLLLVLPPTRALVNRTIRNRARKTFGLGTDRRRATVAAPAPDDPIDVEVLEVRRNPHGQRE